MTSKNLLLVEDDITLGELLLHVLDQTGHEATWFVRARLQDDVLILMDADGAETILQPANFELALVDYRLKGSPVDGPEVTSHLVKKGVPVVAISGLTQLNDIMIEAGARGGISKDRLFSGILRRELLLDHTFVGVK